MIIILNGSIGVGKTSTSWELMKQFNKSIMLDGDFIGSVHPFSLYDETRINYLYDTIVHLIKFHQANGYQDFVINYVFETTQQLKDLTDKLQPLGLKVNTYWLTCSAEVQVERIRNRNNKHLDWELKRGVELSNILYQENLMGFIGQEIHTTDLTTQEVMQKIWKLCS